ncbi:MAG: hypothetical protein C0497_06370 [Gemmatimonas sp.]|nr:hypothetical protein [Gemmatimonas sp.]
MTLPILADWFQGVAANAAVLFLLVATASLQMRVGSIPIALDGIVSLGAAIAATTSPTLTGPGSLLAALAVGLVLGSLSTFASHRAHANDLIIGVSLLMLTGVAAQMLSGTFGNAPGSTFLNEGRLPGVALMSSLFVMAVIGAIIVWFSGLARGLAIIGSAPKFAFIADERARANRHRAVILSCASASVVGALLAHKAGAWSPSISGGSGFLALAAAGLAMRRLKLALALALGYAALDKTVIVFGGASHPDIAMAAPFVLSFVGLAWYSWIESRLHRQALARIAAR